MRSRLGEPVYLYELAQLHVNCPKTLFVALIQNSMNVLDGQKILWNAVEKTS